MKKKILITGVSGFIGRPLAKKLISRGFEVFGVSRRNPQILGLNFKSADVLEKEKIFTIVKNSQIVIHLAAITAHQEIVGNPLKTFEVNFRGTLNVLDAFVKGKGEHFIFPSSGKVYGEVEYLPIDESHSTTPSTILGATKKIAEEAIRLFSILYPEKRFTILRIFNLYGPGQKENFLIPTILKQLEKSPSITIGDIKAKRDYLYIDDLIEAMDVIISRSQNKGLEIFNLASGKAWSAEEIVRYLEEILNRKIKIKIDRRKFRKGEPPEERAISSLKKLGWQPKISLKEGLKRTVDRYNKF